MSFSSEILSQITEDFNDGNFGDGTPLTWVASQTSGGNDFVISSGEVQSNGPMASGDIYLSTNLGIDYMNNDVVWTFKARYTGGGPSATNRIEIYLSSDIEDVSGSPTGYYIGIGETGSTDGIDLFKTGTGTAIINDDNDLAGSGIDIHVRVTRTSIGEWTVEADPTGGDSFAEIGTVSDTEFTTGDYFGFYVQHTSTRFDDFFFDDFSVTVTPVADTDPPTIQSATAISATEIDVQFNENVDQTSAETAINYVLDGGIDVSAASLDVSDQSIVHLTTDPLVNGTSYTLTISNVEDESGNVISANSQTSFEYLVLETAELNDVVINEFNAAPNVSSTIPNAEFIELFNRSNKYISLENWKLSDQSGSSSAFDLDTLGPGAYMILTSTGNGSLFESYGEVLEVASFPSLNNGGDSIILTNASSTVIHETAYTSSTSGISTELINPNGPDYSENNYDNSTDPDGGTPGEQNSIFDDTPDTTPPTISAISVISSTELNVTFDEPLKETTAETLGNYGIDGGITVNTATLDASNNRLVHLTVSTLTSGEVRTLTVTGVEDLSGNANSNATIDFEYIETETAEVNDVVINEILASPSATSTIPNAEYAEIFNRSSKFIDLSGWTLSDAAGSSATFSTYILRPDSYLILTETDNGALFTTYGEVLEISNFPALNNGGDSIILTNAFSTVIHETAYTSSSSGISIELINPNGPDYSENNYGNSTDPDGGTPGEQNSIFDDTPDTTAPLVSTISIISSTELDVTFDEPLNETSAETVGNYGIDGGITVNTATLDASNNRLVHLTVSTLTSGEVRTLTVNGVEDLSGNATSNAAVDFEYIETETAEVNDVVINEFLASPNASSTIPNAEYVEIFNRSSKFIDLSGWTLSDAAGSSAEFSAYILRPDSFLILTETDNGTLFTTYGEVLEVNNFPSLNNGGDSIILTNTSFTVSHETAYTSSSSGISTELINPNGPDYSENNYGNSTDPDGGTPGEQNSIFDDTPDTTPPAISRISVISSTELDVSFDEPLKEATAETVGNYSIDGGNTVSAASLDEANNRLVHLIVSDLPSGETRTLTVNGVEDLSGNATSNATVDFEYIETETAEVNDVLINEFLADPIPSIGLPEGEFVELYNRSEKNINLLGWTLDGSGLGAYVLEANAYVIIVDDSNINKYELYENVLEVASLSLSNDEDQIVLRDSSDLLIHSISFEGSLSGVSTELINPDDPCLSITSYALSVDESGGTPGSINSIFDDSPDTDLPSVLSYDFDGVLTINFSEVMDSLSLVNGTYTSTELSINEIAVMDPFPNAVSVSFSEELEPGTIYQLSIADVEDCAGNTIEESIVSFGIGRDPNFNELIITEIMFDPEPQIGLPNREYIEIYNTSQEIINTENVMLLDATDSVEMPKRMINPGTYYTVTPAATASEFEGNVFGLSGFPSLNNTGERLILLRNSELIFSLDYSPDWHDADKSGGGYSLEIKDLANPCLEDANWGSSQDARGGTPGAPNSIAGNFPDNFPPGLEKIVVIGNQEIRLDFNEKLSPETQGVVVQAIPEASVAEIIFSPEFERSLFVFFDEELATNTLYTASISGVSDCSGNLSNEETSEFTLPLAAEEGDIKLSELLFNPRSNGVDFVEIYNDSEKFISLKNWSLANFNDQGNVASQRSITSGELVIDPQEYLIFTTDANLLLTNYPKGVLENFIEVASLPSFPNSEGSVVLLDGASSIVESFVYDEDFHYGLLESVDGVSLERISFDQPNSEENWRSASSTEGFATPGYKNSQEQQAQAASGKISANPEVFVPGNAGSGRDFTTINYQLENPGQFANVSIFDQSGRLIKTLAQGALLSTEGFLRWDGDTDSGGMARMGYYLIIFEIYDSSGSSEVIKETVVVGRDF